MKPYRFITGFSATKLIGRVFGLDVITINLNILINSMHTARTDKLYKPQLNKGIRFTSYLPLLSLFLLATIIISFGACKSKRTAGPQPTLDSVYIEQYMSKEPAFKEHVIWAKEFYKERNFTLGWFKNHEIVPQADSLLSVIKKAGEEGLDPKDYQVKDFDKLFEELKNVKKDTARRSALEKEIDVALSGTYFNWASDYYRGLVIPRDNEGIDWDVKRNKIKLHKALLTVLGDRESKYPYAEFKPLHHQYANLKKALVRYRSIQAKGGWPTIPSGTKLKPGQSSTAVPLLRKRLGIPGASGQDSTASGGNVYDDQLVTAVKAFQTQNGLNPDGNINAETLKALNVPIQQRISQIIINMERWRWIPKSFEADHIIVNIPEFKLKLFKDSQEVMNMKVIVGKEMNATPIFSDKMEYVVISPYWNIPPNILREEIAPKIMEDPGYLERNDMEVITHKGAVVSASSVDWSGAGTEGFGYIVRKRPGPNNDLGNVKFIFPNVDNIYLHDTPRDELFSQAKRGFSHGCVRVEKPIELAETLLKDVPGSWNRSKIMQQVSTQKEKYVPLKAKLPVYLVYFTAWADSNGNAHFREDLYGHDQTLKQQYFSKL